MKRTLLSLAAGAFALLLAACKHTPPANVAAEVNGHAITTAEMDKAYQTNYAQQSEGASEDQVMIQKLEILRGLIDSEIMLQRAEKLGLNATDADVEAEISKKRAAYTKEEFDKQLADRHMSMDDLKGQVRRQLTIDKLINKEITSKITITDADVRTFYEANKAGFNLAEPAIHMAQILVTPFPDPNVRNLKNSKAQNEKDAKLKIEDNSIVVVHEGESTCLFARGRHVYGVGFVAKHSGDQLQYRLVVIDYEDAHLAPGSFGNLQPGAADAWSIA